ncbi:class I SAM-dependent methyltransferase [Candidatus Kaiserbacteria bacterium]|nr:class I SAM-dependent methyltransferase [Candidatus Kaiserbacteria bacterium]
MSSQHRFGYEWDTYAQMTPDYERQFRNWTNPLAPEDWKGKDVLDAGCGMGRNSYWPLKWGATSGTAFDYDERSVARAKETLKEFPNASVHFKSIFEIDWHEAFDIAYSIGVIHHLEDPKLALARMTEALRPGGTLLIWVYSYEGNEWIPRFVDPIRKGITSRLPVSLVHVLSYFCSVPLFLFVKVFRGPSAYLRQVSTFDFWHLHSIVFDQLIPDIAYYWKRSEVEALVEGLSLSDVHVDATPEGTGWILRATKQG